MGIDGIGKSGGLPPTPDMQGTGAVGSTHAPSKAFHVERGDATGAQATDKTAGTEHAGGVGAADTASPLARLRAGEIDVNGYVDLKIDQATSRLKGLSPSKLEDIKSVLRDQMMTDPELVDLVHRATGQMPKPPEE
ncbi:MAG: hypothetical protein FWD69_02135 [Polyangiaceae bacterium]|nr:hypothetical protein [Polyangiaceae bacterium]